MKYIIEGNLDFYKELNNSLEANPSDESNDNDIDINSYQEINTCLISNSKLEDNWVELSCGHKFNYGPLFKDILNYKRKFNNMEQSKFKLKPNEIRCPYCRKIQQELLPYYKELNYPKEHGVNYLDPLKQNNYFDHVSSINLCQFETIITGLSGNTVINKCYHYGWTHDVLKEKYDNSNKYCYSHKKVLLKEIKQKEKDKIKLEKLLLKEEAKKKKLELKQLLKNKNKNKDCENVVISDIIINNDNDNENINIHGCSALLKSGQRKGEKCGLNICQDFLCKRHFNLKNKYIKV